MAKEAINTDSIKSAITSTETQRQQMAEEADTSKFSEVIENSKKAIAQAKIGSEEAAARTTQAGIAEQEDIIKNPPKIMKKSGKKSKMVPDMNAVRAAQKKKANLQTTLAKQQATIQELKGKANTHGSAAEQHGQTAATKNAQANQLDSQSRSDKAKLDNLNAESQVAGEVDGKDDKANEQVATTAGVNSDASKVQNTKSSGANEKAGSESKEKQGKVDSGNHRF